MVEASIIGPKQQFYTVDELRPPQDNNTCTIFHSGSLLLWMSAKRWENNRS
jgi:hypothetical protein